MTTAERQAYRFSHRLRVRWAEVDWQGIVFNAHYLMYIDTAIADYWRALAMPYPQALTHFGGDLFVRKATCEYHASARYDDQIEVTIRCARVGNSSIQFDAAIFRAEELLLTAELVYVYADPAAKKSMAVPQEFRQILESYEAGKPMVQVRVGSWEELGTVAQQIRHEVFIDEQKIPAELEWDGADESCLHAVAFNLYGLPLATGRLLEHVPGVAKIGRMAVRREMRGGHTGRAVLEGLMAAARARGDVEAVLHAQVSAEGFYARCGFAPRGPRFDEAGIEHVEMVRSLR